MDSILSISTWISYQGYHPTRYFVTSSINIQREHVHLVKYKMQATPSRMIAKGHTILRVPHRAS